MKTITSTTVWLLITFTAITLFCNFDCSKKDVQPNPGGGNNGGNSDVLDNTKPYVAYYSLSDGLQINNPHYVLAPGYSTISIHVLDDTTTIDFSFSNPLLKNDDAHTNTWFFCNNLLYDLSGVDYFNCFSRYTGGTQGNLTEATVYNCSYFKDGVGVLSYDASNGLANYSHRHKNNSVVASMNSYFGGNGVNVHESYIKVEKLENGTASGTFSFGFLAGCERGNGIPYANNIIGKFNKIPIVY